MDSLFNFVLNLYFNLWKNFEGGYEIILTARSPNDCRYEFGKRVSTKATSATISPLAVNY